MAIIRTVNHSDGSTHYKVAWRDGGGRDGKQTSETFDTKAEAELLRDYLNANGQSYTLAEEAFIQSRAHGPTMAEMAETHVRRLTGVADRTRADYRRDIRLHLIPGVGRIRAGQLTRANVRDWINSMEDDGVAPKSISNYHGLLSAIMNTAIEEGVRSDNPCKGVRLPERDRRGDSQKFMEPAEYKALLAEFPDRWKPLVETLAGTGARWGEAVALTVRDVVLDAEVPYVNIDKAWKRDDNNRYYVERPKTRRSVREVTIDDNLATKLAALCEGREPDDWVFTAARGGPVYYHGFYRDVWGPTMRRMTTKATARRRKPHDLRHSHGSWLAADGVDLATISRRMGHESITTTVNIYGHISARSQRAAADALGRILG